MKEYWDNLFTEREIIFPYDENLKSDLKYLKHKKLLDIGAGDGRNLCFFINNGFDVSCLDYSQVALKKINIKAKNNNIKIKTYLIDLYQDSIGSINDKFNTITMLHFFPSLEKLRELSCLLETEGIIYCSTFINDNLKPNSSKYSIGISSEEIKELRKYFKIIKERISEDERGKIYTFMVTL